MSNDNTPNETADTEGSRRWFGKAVLLGAPIVAAAVMADSREASAAPGSPWVSGGNTTTGATETLGTANVQPLVVITSGVEQMRVETDGRVGVGLTTPSVNAQLHVRTTTRQYTARLDNSATNGVCVLGNATGPGGRGVTGQSSGTNGSAIAGYGLAPGTGVNGVYGESQTVNGAGVKGVATATGGVGVLGSHSGPGLGVGVSGFGSTGVSANGRDVGVDAFGSNTGVSAAGSAKGLLGTGQHGVTGVGFANFPALPTLGVRGEVGASVASPVTWTLSPGVLGWSSQGDGVQGRAVSAGGAGVLGSYDGPGLGVGVSGYGTTGVSANGRDVGVDAFGSNTGVSGVGSAKGVLGTGQHGVTGVGFANFPALPTVGVRGEVGATVATPVMWSFSPGVLGWSSQGDGVQGRTVSSGRAGVAGTYDGTGPGIGVYGAAPTGAGQYAAVFGGNVQVAGVLSKSSGTFKIDHPQDPANRYLVHSFVESPEMKNIYDGVVVCDLNGEATVEMPSYFEALNRTFRYQLTCVGGFSPVYVREEILDGRFTIDGGTAGLKVSWMVTGVRQDAFAEANPIVVEPEKADADRGMFLHPNLFGLDETRRIGFSKLVNAKGTA
jgi:trimeric autotransporter adhesin